MNVPRPRIAYLLHRFPGNTDTFIKRELRYLMQAGSDVSVISIWQPKPQETSDVSMAEWSKHTEFAMQGSRMNMVLAAAKFIARRPRAFAATALLAWKTAKPGVRGVAMQAAYFLEAVLAADIIKQRGITHIHNHIGDQSGSVSMLAARLVGISYSITFHGWPVFVDAYNTQVGEKCRRAAFTRSISYFCRSQLMFFAGSRDAADYKIVRCGLELENYRYRPPRGETERLLTVARLSFEKGMGFLLEAVKILRDRGQNVSLRFAGDGPDRAALEAMSRDLNLADCVTFLGYLGEDAVRKELEAADAFVLPSFIEGVPVSAMEAMATGVPVIATNVGGTGELVLDGHTGMLVRPSDPQSIADAVLKLKSDPGLAAALARNGREMVERDYDGTQEFAKLKHHFDTYGLRPWGSSQVR
jgi:colanic acid/amylovoran biosynthesis glycosyltransferase